MANLKSVEMSGWMMVWVGISALAFGTVMGILLSIAKL